MSPVNNFSPMKDSGITWVGKIPSHWNDINPKALFTQRKDRANLGDRQLTASQQYGIVYQDEYMELTGSKVVTVEKDFSILKRVEVGDFVISMRSFQGGLEYSTKSGSISSAYVMLIPNLDLVYPRFYRWLLKCNGYIDALQSTSDLIRDGQAMRYSNFAQVRLITLPLMEQEKIAEYLDAQCAKIDNVIAEAKASIEEYKAWKASIIYEAVTKGLDPNVEMKDSGVAWVGLIPLAWNVQKLKTLVSEALQYGANETGIDYDENLPRYIRITDVTSNGELKDTGKLSLSEDVAREYILDDGDILLARSGGTVGKAFYYKSEYGRAAFAGYMIKVRVNRDIIHPKLVYFATLAANYDDWKATTMTQATIQNIGANKYNDFYVVVPPKDQQDTLVAYLEEKSGQIDALITEKESLIADLEDYKKSLIFEVVTGKRKV